MSYWKATRHPAPCLFFVLPILAIYEFGVIAIGAGLTFFCSRGLTRRHAEAARCNGRRNCQAAEPQKPPPLDHDLSPVAPCLHASCR